MNGSVNYTILDKFVILFEPKKRYSCRLVMDNLLPPSPHPLPPFFIIFIAIVLSFCCTFLMFFPCHVLR